MPISATFLADFSDFNRAVTDATVKLKGFETGASRVEGSLNRMVDRFSGRKLIQDAVLMAEAVERIGGTAKLTEKELARVAATTAEATAKLQAMGQTVPASLQRVATATAAIPKNLQTITTATTTTTGALGNFNTGLSQTDKILAALGIHIGPQIQAIGELGQASGKTAAQLGLMATAGLALGAGLAGWQIGRMIAQFADLDTKIGKATASLLGWGNEGAEIAAAKAEVFRRAMVLSGRTITDYNEAVRIVTEGSKAAAESFNTAAHRVSLWQSEIAKVKRAGTLDALKADLASQNSTLEELSTHYGISARALDYLQRQQKAAADAAKTHSEALKQQAVELERQQQAIDAFIRAQAADLSFLSAAFNVSQRQMLETMDKVAAAAEAMPVPKLWQAMIDAVPPDIESQAASATDAIVERAGLIDDAIAGMSFGISQSLSDALVGLQSFKDGFLGVWRSIQQGISRILSEMLNAFVQRFLHGMLNAMAGQQGAFSKAFEGLFGAGGGIGGLLLGGGIMAGVGALVGGLSRLFGGGDDKDAGQYLSSAPVVRGGLRRDAQWNVTLQKGAIAIDGRDKTPKEIAREIAPAMVDTILRENPDGTRTKLRRGLTTVPA